MRRGAAYEEWRRSRAATEAIVDLRSRAENARRAVLTRHAPALARLAPDERGMVEAITRQVVARLLHEPTVELRRSTQGVDGEWIAPAPAGTAGTARVSGRPP